MKIVNIKSYLRKVGNKLIVVKESKRIVKKLNKNNTIFNYDADYSYISSELSSWKNLLKDYPQNDYRTINSLKVINNIENVVRKEKDSKIATLYDLKGRLVSVATYKDNNPNYIFIGNLVVNPKFNSRLAGTQATYRLVDLAVKQNKKTVKLTPLPEAETFYKELGFISDPTLTSIGGMFLPKNNAKQFLSNKLPKHTVFSMFEQDVLGFAFCISN